MIPESSTFLDQVEGSIRGGATIVQLREKSILTLDFIKRARQVQILTNEYNIPLIINDRVDVALAIDADGVHVGQDDMPATLVRKLIGPEKILGVTCSNVDEVKQVIADGVADYVGLGTVYATATKKDVDEPLGIGPIGIILLLKELKNHEEIKSVAIGGINHSNAEKVLVQCKSLDGVAVVSCIMAAGDANKATLDLLSIMTEKPTLNNFITKSPLKINYLDRILIDKPLVHHITNNVVKNFSANVTLAIGASPIMSELTDEFEEFTAIEHIALLINLGTPNKSLMDIMIKAIQVYNKARKPVIFDPVACGASKARLDCCKKILNSGQVHVIKGNIGEISAIFKLTTDYDGRDIAKMKGVDSTDDLPFETLQHVGRMISEDFGCVVVITGKVDYIIWKEETTVNSHGHELLASVTGTGCSLGSVIAAVVAVAKTNSSYDVYEAARTAVEFYTVVSEKAARKTGDNATGSFMINFIDELSKTARNSSQEKGN